MKGHKRLILGLWFAAVLGFWFYTRQQGLSVSGLMQSWLKGLSSSALGPLMLMGLYLLRPLLLLPVTILTIFSGFLFGPWWGGLYAILASTLSASVAFWIGRFFGAGALTGASAQRFLRQLRTRSFETLMISRLMFLPGDLVNYGAGFVRVSFGTFVVTTILGGAPGLMFGVLAGAALEGPFKFEGLAINASYLSISACLLLFSLGLSFWLKRRSSATNVWVDATSADRESQRR